MGSWDKARAAVPTIDNGDLAVEAGEIDRSGQPRGAPADDDTVHGLALPTGPGFLRLKERPPGINHSQERSFIAVRRKHWLTCAPMSRPSWSSGAQPPLDHAAKI